MVQINFAQKQINAKIVYYGPGMSGKTTNLEVVHQRAPSNNRGELTSISTDGDRTLFFDYMPLDLGTIAGMKTCFQMYTVPGQVYYNSTRKLVLQGVDGVIFVADSSAKSMEQNLESLRNLEENLNEYGKSLATLPHVIQYNKRDLPDALPVQELEAQLNLNGAQTFEACAATGEGVFPTLKGLAAAVLKNIQNECGGGTGRTAFHSVAARPGVTSSGPQPRPASMPPAPQRAPQTASTRPQPTGAQASSSAPSGAPLKQTGFQPRTAALAAEPSSAPASAPAGQLMQNAAAAAPQPKPAQRPRPAAARPQAAPAPAPAKPAKAAKAPAPAAQPKRRAAAQPSSAAAPKLNTSGPSTAKTAAFVIVAAVIGAVVAKFALDFI